jgi:Tol biopolymer transport system component
MSAHDHTVALLGGLDGPVEPRAEFADALIESLLVELGRPRQRRFGTRTLLLAAAIFLVLAAVATAAYLIERSLAVTPHGPPSGTLTLIDQESNGTATIVAVLPGGRKRVVWRCPDRVRFCGDLTSVDWSPDGTRVAFTLDEIGGRSAFVGLHVLDLRTGRDLHIPSVPLAHPLSPNQPLPVLEAEWKQMRARLGCGPADVAWSPNGRRLAYGCRGTPEGARIYTIASDGTDRKLLHTGTRNAFDPSWSPDGTRIVFATSSQPSSIYTVRLDGSGRRLLARDGETPDWSPDGSAIAYDSSRGVRLVSPSGVDLTPRTGPIAPPGVPSWSPDGSRIAVETADGTVLVDTSTWHRTIASSAVPQSLYGFGRRGRPAWYPGSSPPQLAGTKSYAPHCRSCL